MNCFLKAATGLLAACILLPISAAAVTEYVALLERESRRGAA